MTDLRTVLGEAVGAAFAAEGVDAALAKVTTSDRPDLADFQSNGALAAAKALKAPAPLPLFGPGSFVHTDAIVRFNSLSSSGGLHCFEFTSVKVFRIDSSFKPCPRKDRPTVNRVLFRFPSGMVPFGIVIRFGLIQFMMLSTL